MFSLSVEWKWSAFLFRLLKGLTHHVIVGGIYVFYVLI